MNEYFRKIYYDFSHPASFGSAAKLHRQAKIDNLPFTLTDAKKFLSTSDTYTSHRNVIQKFPRRKTISSGLNVHWESDLIDVQSLKQWNRPFGYILISIDVFNRYVYATPIRTKSNIDVVNGFKKIFKQAKAVPENMQVDRGAEWYGKVTRDFLKSKHINLFSSKTNTQHKASIVERVIRTLKNKIWKVATYRGNFKYIDVLQKIVQGYNNSVHSAIEAPPSSVTPENQYYFWQKFHRPSVVANQTKPKKFLYAAGQTVRISKNRHKFARGFKSGWSLEQFKIDKRYNNGIPTYSLKDLLGEQILGRFYQHELQPSEKSATSYHSVEKILKSRGKGKNKQFLVRWKDYGPQFDSWVSSKDLKYSPAS